MAVAQNQQIIDALNELVTMDRSAAAAYEAAVGQIQNPQIAKQIRSFQQDHERHVRDLGKALDRLGGKSENKPEIEKKLARSADQVRKISDMRELMEGMRKNEELTNEMYRRCVDDAQNLDDDDLRDLLQRNYADEQRHLSWIEDHLKQMGQGGQQRSGGGRVNLNSASAEEIARIEGIGERRAEVLVNGRPYSSWDDVRNIEGFDEVLIDKLRNETTLD